MGEEKGVFVINNLYTLERLEIGPNCCKNVLDLKLCMTSHLRSHTGFFHLNTLAIGSSSFQNSLSLELNRRFHSFLLT